MANKVQLLGCCFRRNHQGARFNVEQNIPVESRRLDRHFSASTYCVDPGDIVRSARPSALSTSYAGSNPIRPCLLTLSASLRLGATQALGIVHSPASFISLLQAYSYSMQPELVGQLMQRAFGSCHSASSSSSSPTHHHQQGRAHWQ